MLQIEQTQSNQQHFQFDVMKPSVPQEKSYFDHLQKWGIDQSLQIHSYRFDMKYDDLHCQQFLLDFLHHPIVRQTLPYIHFPKEYVANLEYDKLACNLVKLDMFDKLIDRGLVVNDSIRKTFEDFYEEIEISDSLREVLLKEESEHYPIFTSQDREQFLFKVFQLLVCGGQLCQYEDKLTPYLEQTKTLYKQLVTARKDPVNSQIFIESFAYAIKKIDKTYINNHPQNVMYVIVNPSLRQVNVLQNQWLKIW